MADISLIQDESLDDSDEGVFEQSDSQTSCSADYEGCPIYMRIQKYAHHRQMLGKVIQDWFKTTSGESIEENLPQLMTTIEGMIESNLSLKQDWLEQIPNFASQVAQCSYKAPILDTVTVDYLLPIVISNLGTSENFVNKAAQQALLQLMQQKLITLPQIEIKVCPTVLGLSKDMENAADGNPGIVTLMSKMLKYMGADTIERVFLKRFTELCSSQLFYVRRACATHFGDFSYAVRKETFENTLLPCYLELCKDSISGVRGSSAQVAMFISSLCSSNLRKTVMTPVFNKLLKDECRWVRLSAFNTLGAFISTFAEPPIIKLEYNEKGDLTFSTDDGNEYRIASIQHIENVLETILSPTTKRFRGFDPLNKDETFHLFKDLLGIELSDSDILADDENCSESALCERQFTENIDSNEISEIQDKCTENIDSDKTSEITDNKECDILDNRVIEGMQNLQIIKVKEGDNSSSTDVNSNQCNVDDKKCEHTPKIVAVDNSGQQHEITFVNISEENNESRSGNNNVRSEDEDPLHLYNSYNYWYIKPELPIESSVANAGGDSSENPSNEEPGKKDEEKDALPETTTEELTGKDKSDTEEEKSEEQNQDEDIIEENFQHTVPKSLIDHYISMTDPNLINNFDHEMTYQCAYSLPAVAITLGPDNWYLLKDTVEILAADRQYKVRRTVAGYLHELALILGPDIASESLTPLFDGFIKDLDEVRIEVLKNLASFLRLVNPSNRSACLPRLAEFLKIDHQWNWRFRQELAKQLAIGAPLFRPTEVAKHLAPIAHELLCDNVAAVRLSAIQLVTSILKHTSGETIHNTRLLFKLSEVFAHSMKWKRRQTFALLCCELLAASALKPEKFASDVMPHLLDLSWDPVANVRLVVARALTRHILVNDYFSDPNNQFTESLDTVLRRLQADKDRDVRQATEIEEC